MKLQQFDFSGAHAVLTGAASGMGEQLAYQLAGLGSKLVLVDRDVIRLGRVAAVISDAHPGAVLGTHVLNLAEATEVAEFLRNLAQDHDRIDLLINNAGVALGGRFMEVTAEEFDWVQAINFRAPVALARGVLPLMSVGAQVVNISSLFGLVAPPGQTAYSASKFALRGFSEALRRELAAEGIGVTTVHPGGVRTRIAESAKIAATATSQEAAAGRAAFARMLGYPADQAATEILDGIHKRRARVVITPEAKLVDVAARLLPVAHLEVVQEAQRRTRRTARLISLKTARPARSRATSKQAR